MMDYRLPYSLTLIFCKMLESLRSFYSYGFGISAPGFLVLVPPSSNVFLYLIDIEKIFLRGQQVPH